MVDINPLHGQIGKLDLIFEVRKASWRKQHLIQDQKDEQESARWGRGGDLLLYICMNGLSSGNLNSKETSEGESQYSFICFYQKVLIYLFIYFWLHWVFVAARGLSLVAASRGYSSLWCSGFSLQWLLLLQSTGSRCTGFSSCGTWTQ